MSNWPCGKKNDFLTIDTHETPLQLPESRGHEECAALLRSALEPWSPAIHALFPPAFRAAAVAVLGVHNRRPGLVGDEGVAARVVVCWSGMV